MLTVSGFISGGMSILNVQTVLDNLKRRGFHAAYFETKEAAAAQLAAELHGTSIGFGGSVTAQQMGLFELLGKDNEVFWHWKDGDRMLAQQNAAHAKVYILSANALSETGELVNIDGNGNRVASSLYGHERVIFLVGVNKLTPDLPSAIDRARNVASPLNARRLNRKTPCALSEPMKCHDCASPERICSGIVIHTQKMGSIRQMDVYLIGEELGY